MYYLLYRNDIKRDSRFPLSEARADLQTPGDDGRTPPRTRPPKKARWTRYESSFRPGFRVWVLGFGDLGA